MQNMVEMEFCWDDGGRASCGFVGLTGDCVARSIAIATGLVYRDVYRDLGQAAEKSPRDGVRIDIADRFLSGHGWRRHRVAGSYLPWCDLPSGVVILHVGSPNHRSTHMCTVVDHTIRDTWNPSDDSDIEIMDYWSPDPNIAVTIRRDVQSVSGVNAGIDGATDETLTQSQFDKILKRLVALDKTAQNDASTEGEKRNALRMMQTLMLRHNLTRQDIHEDDNVDSVQFTRIACPVNGSRACNWEKDLASYVTHEIFPTVQWYFDRKGHRTWFWFFGPKDDVQNSIALFRELLVTIATAAHLQYGGYARGSGASYAEGYVRGLPKSGDQQAEGVDQVGNAIVSEQALIHVRTLAIQNASSQWLDMECGMRLVTVRGSGRYKHDPDAADRGKQHGSQHELPQGGKRQLRIGN
ncbi:DUF2786 domain-containing protein [Stieleria varia]|uniref:Uncharacterized protein n=1 Tax=Stieleria varia TaxID=2528005 RepID=A0A5C6B198_9BACT|nr:DUF2786 domain-containing protein [Stieleria varia]TWU05648.1 hypothetical protein Pla52n_13630 [Stieleria varia]